LIFGSAFQDTGPGKNAGAFFAERLIYRLKNAKIDANLLIGRIWF